MSLRAIGTVDLPPHRAAGGFDHASVHGDRLYVAVGDPGVLQSIDTGAGRVVESIATGRGAHTFGFDAGREHVYALLPDAHAAAVLAER